MIYIIFYLFNVFFIEDYLVDFGVILSVIMFFFIYLYVLFIVFCVFIGFYRLFMIKKVLYLN